MPQIVPIRDLKNTTEISKLCHTANEPIFITYSSGHRNTPKKGRQDKNKSSFRTLPLFAGLAQYLRQIQTRQEEQRKIFGNQYDKSGYVCCREDGHVIQPDYLSKGFYKLEMWLGAHTIS